MKGAMRDRSAGGFGRQTLVAACEALESHTQASFSQMVIRLELEGDISDDARISVRKKCGRLAKIVVRQAGAEIDTTGGRMSLGEAVIREAVATLRNGSTWEPQQRFEQALAREGYALRWDGAGAGFAWGQEKAPVLVPAMPAEIREEEADDEVRELLGKRGFWSYPDSVDG